MGGIELQKWFKKMVTGFCVVLMLFSVVGCSKKADSASAAAATSEEVTLSVWLPAQSENENKVITEIMDAYNEMNKGKVKVEYEFVPRANAFAYEDKISAAVTINQLPDLLMMDGPNVSNYAHSEIVKPLDEYFSKEDLTDFVDSVVSQGTYDNKLYSLGATESSVVLYYNKDIIEAAGITVPTSLDDAWTFDEFQEIVAKVHQEGKVYGVNIAPDYGTGEWMTYMPTFFVWANGGDIISPDGMKAQGYVNSDVAVNSMKKFQNLAKYSNWQATPTEFEEGRAAFKICGSWLVPSFEANPDLHWGVTYLPYGTTHVAPCGDWTWGISSDKHMKESVDFLKYVLSGENMDKFVTVVGKPPTRKSLLNAEGSVWDKYPRNVIKDQVINAGHPRPKTPAYPIITQEFAAASVDIFLGADAKERMDKAAENIDKSLEKQFQ